MRASRDSRSRRLGLDPPGDVGRKPQDRGLAGRRIAERHLRRLVPARTAVGMDEPFPLDGPRTARFDHGSVALAIARDVFGRGAEVGVGAADDPFVRRAEGLLDDAVDEQEAAVGVLREQEAGHEVDDRPDPRIGGEVRRPGRVGRGTSAREHAPASRTRRVAEAGDDHRMLTASGAAEPVWPRDRRRIRRPVAKAGRDRAADPAVFRIVEGPAEGLLERDDLAGVIDLDDEVRERPGCCESRIRRVVFPFVCVLRHLPPPEAAPHDRRCAGPFCTRKARRGASSLVSRAACRRTRSSRSRSGPARRRD